MNSAQAARFAKAQDGERDALTIAAEACNAARDAWVADRENETLRAAYYAARDEKSRVAAIPPSQR